MHYSAMKLFGPPIHLVVRGCVEKIAHPYEGEYRV